MLTPPPPPLDPASGRDGQHRFSALRLSGVDDAPSADVATPAVLRVGTASGVATDHGGIAADHDAAALSSQVALFDGPSTHRPPAAPTVVSPSSGSDLANEARPVTDDDGSSAHEDARPLAQPLLAGPETIPSTPPAASSALPASALPPAPAHDQGAPLASWVPTQVASPVHESAKLGWRLHNDNDDDGNDHDRRGDSGGGGVGPSLETLMHMHKQAIDNAVRVLMPNGVVPVVPSSVATAATTTTTTSATSTSTTTSAAAAGGAARAGPGLAESLPQIAIAESQPLLPSSTHAATTTTAATTATSSSAAAARPATSATLSAPKSDPLGGAQPRTESSMEPENETQPPASPPVRAPPATVHVPVLQSKHEFRLVYLASQESQAVNEPVPVTSTGRQPEAPAAANSRVDEPAWPTLAIGAPALAVDVDPGQAGSMGGLGGAQPEAPARGSGVEASSSREDDVVDSQPVRRVGRRVAGTSRTGSGAAAGPMGLVALDDDQRGSAILSRAAPVVAGRRRLVRAVAGARFRSVYGGRGLTSWLGNERCPLTARFTQPESDTDEDESSASRTLPGDRDAGPPIEGSVLNLDSDDSHDSDDDLPLPPHTVTPVAARVVPAIPPAAPLPRDAAPAANATVSPRERLPSPTKRLTHRTIRETRISEQVIRTEFEDNSQGERIPIRQEIIDGEPRIHREEMVVVERVRRPAAPAATAAKAAATDPTSTTAREHSDFSFVRRRGRPPHPANRARACSRCGAAHAADASWHLNSTGTGWLCDACHTQVGLKRRAVSPPARRPPPPRSDESDEGPMEGEPASPTTIPSSMTPSNMDDPHDAMDAPHRVHHDRGHLHPVVADVDVPALPTLARQRRAPRSDPFSFPVDDATPSEPAPSNAVLPGPARTTARIAAPASTDALAPAHRTTGFSVGQIVWAKWKDRHYYRGTITKVDHDDWSGRPRYSVAFDDGDTGKCGLADLQVIELSKGDQILAEWAKDQRHYAAVVEAAGLDGRYSVRYVDDGVRATVSAASIALTKAQMDAVVASVRPAKGTPRSQSADAMLGHPAGPASPTSPPPRSILGKRSSSAVPEADLSPKRVRFDGSGSQGGRGGRGHGRGASSSSSSGRGQSAAKPPRASPTAARRASAKAASPPPATARLFAGYTFTLTGPRKRASASAHSGSSVVSQSPPHDLAMSTPPLANADYDRDGLRARIVAAGGTVIDELDETSLAAAHWNKANPRVFVVSDVLHKTKKYYTALAAGVPCVSFTWIRDCLREAQIVDFTGYLLSAGYSMDMATDAPQSFVLSRSREPIFHEKTILVLGSASFQDFLRDVLQAGGATVTVKLTEACAFAVCEEQRVPGTKIADASRGPPTASGLLARDVDMGVYRKVEAEGVPVLSWQWVVQCLIHHRLIDFHSNPMYKIKRRS